MRIVVICLLLFSVSLPSGAIAAKDTLLFAVNEGTSSSMDAIFRQEKYADLAHYLAAATGKNVRVETSNILPILVRNLERKRYDVLLVRPSHISARAMRDQGYRLLVAARGEASVHFIVRGDSPLRSLKDLRGRFIVMPDELAYPTQLGRAVLRDAGIDVAKERVQYMDRQEAVAYAVREKMADAGVVISYSKVAKEWEKQGGRFLHTLDKQPYWSIIVSPNVSAATEQKLREAFLAMDKTAQGQARLASIGVSGFVAGSQKAYMDMLNWSEKKP
jgi:phosphonate transport system substrate-binding protein